ncbi:MULTISPECIES: sulfatase-like hydrolase/transferase [unclassified Streptomyces]|uniref:sulfatase-like hydrolase/transferase n=1 Tax=unclassified Streptomyces TaxID=2593676 RepID=UPI0037F70756
MSDTTTDGPAPSTETATATESAATEPETAIATAGTSDATPGNADAEAESADSTPGSADATPGRSDATPGKPDAETEAAGTVVSKAEAEAESGSAALESEAAVSEAEAEGRADTGTDTDTDTGADTDATSGDASAEGSAGGAVPDAGGRRRGWAAWSGRVRVRRAAWRDVHPGAASAISVGITVLCAALVIAALVMPNTLVGLGPAKFLRIPSEGIVAAAVALALPRRPRIVLATVFGIVLGALTLINFLDMGFTEYLGRSFNAILDWSLLGDAESYLEDTLGKTATVAVSVGAVVLVLLLFVLLALATVRLSNLLARHQRQATRGTLIAGVVWITCSSFGLQIAGGVPLASDRTANALEIKARQVRDTLHDEAEFRKVAKVDAFGNTPADQLVPDLRGKDMIFTFIESYGRSAIEDPIEAPGVDSTLDAQTKALAKAGFAAKSGWLTSATYGGSSWLGHSTTMSGLWVSNQQRYRTVMASDHLSITKAFQKTGDFDTVGVMPGIQKGWPEQSYYGLDKVYNAFQLGYQGPKFSWSTMPDQYALQQFQERVHSKKPADGKSRMSFLILTSSHQPWAPIPKMVPWDQLGDGSVFDAIQKAGNKASDVIADTTKSRQEYGKSVQYSVTALSEWLQRYGNDDTVLVFLGDHQPIARVSGNHANRDVPISIVAKDPKVLDAIDSWNWTDGLRPAHDAPVWKMSAFRDKFLTAYGSTPHPKTN